MRPVFLRKQLSFQLFEIQQIRKELNKSLPENCEIIWN